MTTTCGARTEKNLPISLWQLDHSDQGGSIGGIEILYIEGLNTEDL